MMMWRELAVPWLLLALCCARTVFAEGDSETCASEPAPRLGNALLQSAGKSAAQELGSKEDPGGDIAVPRHEREPVHAKEQIKVLKEALAEKDKELEEAQAAAKAPRDQPLAAARTRPAQPEAEAAAAEKLTPQRRERRKQPEGDAPAVPEHARSAVGVPARHSPAEAPEQPQPQQHQHTHTHTHLPAAAGPSAAKSGDIVTNTTGTNAMGSQVPNEVPEVEEAKPLGLPQTRMSDTGIACVMGVIVSILAATSVYCCIVSVRESGESNVERMEIFDSMSYKTKGLLAWESCLLMQRTVWDNPSLLVVARRLLALSITVALIELFVCHDASSLDPLRFSQIGIVLNVFVALLLGFWLATTVGRWFNCVNAFLQLFESIRNLQMQLHALGVAQEKIDLTMRYGITSAWILCHHLHLDEPREKRASSGLELLVGKDEPFLHLLPEEKELLEKMEDPAVQMWMLVGSLMGRMAQDGEIPPMASPTYGRIIMLAEGAQDAMKQVRQVAQVQIPYLYAHMLAMIVHINNILSALSFGLTLGACIASILVHIDVRLRIHTDVPVPDHLMIADMQDLLIQFFKCFFAPILYQAFLEIGICMSAPFSNEDAAIPTDRLIEELQVDIRNGNEICAKPPMWQRPTFKKP